MMDIDSVMGKLNPLIVRLLCSPLHPLASGGLMVLRVRGVRTDRAYEFPVGYQRSGDKLTVLVSKAPRKQWWRNFREPHPAIFVLRGKELRGRGLLMDKNGVEFRKMLVATLLRVPGLQRQFGIARKFDGQLNDTEWAHVSQQAEAVLFTLTGTG